MHILRGRHAGTTAKPSQFANDWIGFDLPDKTPGTARPDQVRLDPEDRPLFTQANPLIVGQFWSEWRLNDDGTFAALRERRRTRSRRVRRDHG